MQSHHQFFEGGIACTFTDAVNRAFHLTCSIFGSLKEVRHSQAKIIVTMHRDNRAINVWHILFDPFDQSAKLRGSQIADCIGNIDSVCTRCDRSL